MHKFTSYLTPLSFVLVFLFFLLSTSFLFYRAVQFDNNYPNPLPNELTAKSIEIEDESSNINDKCSFPPETGQCRGSFLRYYYNQITNECSSYTYGGCGDFAFETLEECEYACINP